MPKKIAGIAAAAPLKEGTSTPRRSEKREGKTVATDGRGSPSEGHVDRLRAGFDH